MNLLGIIKNKLNVNEYLDNLDFIEFNNYLDNYFIPKFITNIEKKDIIFLSNILILDLSDEHLAYLMKYLEFKNITVIGSYRYLIGEFSNYLYKERISCGTKKVIPKQELEEKVKIYKLGKSDNLRNEIIDDSMVLAKSIFKKYFAKYNFNFYEYLKEIYDSVNSSLDYYNLNEKTKYITYLYNTVIHNISKEIQQNTLGIVDDKFFKYLECINEVELTNGKKIINNLNLIDEVIKLLIEKNIILNKKQTINLTYKKILKILKISLSLDDELQTKQYLDEGYLIDPVNYENKVINKDMIEHVEEFLSCLNEKEKYILKLYFGFYTDRPLLKTEVAKIVNLSDEGVRQNINRSLNKIRKYIKNKNEDLDYINIYSYARH